MLTIRLLMALFSGSSGVILVYLSLQLVFKYILLMNFKQLLPQVTTFIFDVDGVLSSNLVGLFPGVEPVRTANIKDGYAMQLAVKKGYRLIIITGGKSEAVEERYLKLGLEDVYMRSAVKMVQFNEVVKKYNLSMDEIVYMGDDIPDLEVMTKVGVPCCPADASPEIKKASVYISDKDGGMGCGRDIIEQVMKAQGRWMDGEAFGW